MRLITLFFLAFTLYLSAAPSNQTGNGILSYGSESYGSLRLNGSATLNGTTVTQTLQVNGNLAATDAKMGALDANGQVVLNNCTVNKKSLVRGSVAATSSNFQQELGLATHNSVFESCHLASLRILKTKQNTPQIIELKGTTQVIGLITFEAGNGQVIAGPDCQITQESVMGGTLQQSSD